MKKEQKNFTKDDCVKWRTLELITLNKFKKILNSNRYCRFECLKTNCPLRKKLGCEVYGLIKSYNLHKGKLDYFFPSYKKGIAIEVKTNNSNLTLGQYHLILLLLKNDYGVYIVHYKNNKMNILLDNGTMFNWSNTNDTGLNQGNVCAT